MTCAKCGSNKIKVMETLPGCHNNIFRRRKCTECDTLFKTVEIVIDNNEEMLRGYRETPRVKRGVDRIRAYKKGLKYNESN
jgi:transcriptional regulator NrdR family protein